MRGNRWFSQHMTSSDRARGAPVGQFFGSNTVEQAIHSLLEKGDSWAVIFTVVEYVLSS
jgi:hypothetical protein